MGIGKIIKRTLFNNSKLYSHTHTMAGEKYNKLLDKHVFVLGGTNGIGHGVAEAYLAAGARFTISGSVEEDFDAVFRGAAAPDTGGFALLDYVVQCAGPAHRIMGELLDELTAAKVALLAHWRTGALAPGGAAIYDPMAARQPWGRRRCRRTLRRRTSGCSRIETPRAWRRGRAVGCCFCDPGIRECGELKALRGALQDLGIYQYGAQLVKGHWMIT